MKSTLINLSLAVAAAVVIAPGAFAGQQTGTLAVSANVQSECSLAISNVAFGTYSGILANKTTPKDTTGTVTITCTNGNTADVLLGLGGNNTSAVGTSRAMSDGASHFLSYELYSEPTFTSVWDDGTGKVTRTGTGSDDALTVSARIPAGQNAFGVNAGTSYTDSVAVTVNF